MIDLRKDRRQYFCIDKTTLEPIDRPKIKDIWESLFNMIVSQKSSCIDLRNDNNYVEITREEYKVFRKLNQEQKRLFIECY